MLDSLEIIDLTKRLVAVTDYQTQVDFFLMLPYPVLLEATKATTILDCNDFWQTKFARDFPSESQKIIDPNLWKMKYQAVYASKELANFSKESSDTYSNDKELQSLYEQEIDIQEKIKERQALIQRKLDLKKKKLKIQRIRAVLSLEKVSFERETWFYKVKDTSKLLYRANLLPHSGNISILLKFLRFDVSYEKFKNGNIIMFIKNDSLEIQVPIMFIYIWRDLEGNLMYDSTRQYYSARKPGITRFPLKMTENGATNERIMQQYKLNFELAPREEYQRDTEFEF